MHLEIQSIEQKCSFETSYQPFDPHFLCKSSGKEKYFLSLVQPISEAAFTDRNTFSPESNLAEPPFMWTPRMHFKRHEPQDQKISLHLKMYTYLYKLCRLGNSGVSLITAQFWSLYCGYVWNVIKVCRHFLCDFYNFCMSKTISKENIKNIE